MLKPLLTWLYAKAGVAVALIAACIAALLSVSGNTNNGAVLYSAMPNKSCGRCSTKSLKETLNKSPQK